MKGRYRANLNAARAASGVPSGYTLTIWCAGAVAVGRLGFPGVAEVLLFLGGGAAGVLLVDALSSSRERSASEPASPTAALARAPGPLLAAAAAVVCAWLVVEVVGGGLAWALVGCAASVVYLTVLAATATVACRRRSHPPG